MLPSAWSLRQPLATSHATSSDLVPQKLQRMPRRCPQRRNSLAPPPPVIAAAACWRGAGSGRHSRVRCTRLACSSSSGGAGCSSGAGKEEGPVGVVIVDHGSRKAEANDSLLEFAEVYKRITGRELVEVAHMELAEPTLEQAVGRCAAAGARRVIIAPYFLSHGRHVEQDIPALAAAAAATHPSLECMVAEPIGIDALMAQLIEHRVQAAEEGGTVTPRSGTAASPAETAAAR